MDVEGEEDFAYAQIKASTVAEAGRKGRWPHGYLGKRMGGVAARLVKHVYLVLVTVSAPMLLLYRIAIFFKSKVRNSAQTWQRPIVCLKGSSSDPPLRLWRMG